MGGRSFSTAFERRERFLLVGELLWRYWRDCNRRVWKRKISASGPPLGNVEGARLLGLLREREMDGSGNGASLMKLTWAHFLDPDYVRSLSLMANWNSCEGTGLP